MRLLAYTNSANMGIYRDAGDPVAAEARTRCPTSPTTLAHHAQVRIRRSTLEQNLARNLTAFARFGWDNGKTESFAYTEVDQTFAEGIGANGAWWHRKQDRAGMAFVTQRNQEGSPELSAPPEDWAFCWATATLNYGRENIFETYYTVHVWRGIYLAPGVQHINNPGYNRDRGPVVVPTFRAHVEF